MYETPEPADADAEPAPEEEWMRADLRRQRDYLSLINSGALPAVVEANRAYLRTAVDDLLRTERDGWTLSCMPAPNAGRLSEVNIKSSESFIVRRRAAGSGGPAIDAAVVAMRTVLERGFGSVAEAARRFGLTCFERRDGSVNQVRLVGGAERLLEAFADSNFAAAVRAHAQSAMSANQAKRRWEHNYQLADQVLNR